MRRLPYQGAGGPRPGWGTPLEKRAQDQEARWEKRKKQLETALRRAHEQRQSVSYARRADRPPNSLVKAAGSIEADAVMAKMREIPINDFMSRNAILRVDGRVERETYLFEVKRPEESSGPWDLYKKVATVPAKEAVRPLSDGKCPLVPALQ